MNRSVRWLGHPVHQMLVVLPAGLLLTTFLADLWYLLQPGMSVARLSHSLLPLGLAAGALAAPFGFLDWRRLPNPSRARRVGALHGLANGTALLLFLVSWLMRTDGAPPPWPALLTSVAGGSLMVLAAWLGGELVTRLGVGVYDDAHVDAPSSLKQQELAPPTTAQPLHGTASPLAPMHTPTIMPTMPPTRQPASQDGSFKKAQSCSTQPRNTHSAGPSGRMTAAASPEDMSVAGEEDPGAAIDTTDMRPPPGERSGR